MKKVLSLVLALVMLVSVASVLTSCGDVSGQVKVIDIALTEEEYAFAVQKGDAELKAALDSFMATIKADGTFDAIMNKYFGDGTPTPVVSAETMKTDGSQLIVATNAAFPPFEYMEGVNYYGVDMEIMKLFADHLGKELYINNMEFDAVCLSVSAAGGTYEDGNGNEVQVAGGVCDVAAAGLTVNDTRKQILDFSTTYYNASQKIIVSANNTTFDNCETVEDVEAILNAMGADIKVGVQTATTGQKYCEGDEDWGFDGFKFTTIGYTNAALATQNILNGNLDMVVIDEGPAAVIAKKVNEAN